MKRVTVTIQGDQLPVVIVTMPGATGYLQDILVTARLVLTVATLTFVQNTLRNKSILAEIITLLRVIISV